MNWIDITILAVIGLSVVIGIFRGLIREALSLINWGCAIFASFYFHDTAQGYLKSFIDPSSVRSIVAFVVVFLIFILIGSLLTHFIGFIVKKSGLSGTDRMLGLIFGFVRGVLVCGVILAIIGFTPVKKQQTWQEATLLPTFSPLITWLNINVSDKITKALEEEQLLNNNVIDKATKVSDSLIEINEVD